MQVQSKLARNNRGSSAPLCWNWHYLQMWLMLKIYFNKNLPDGKRARPLVPLRLALLAIRRKLISGGSHNWGGGASETTNFRSWKFYLISKHFFLSFTQSWKKTKETKSINVPKSSQAYFHIKQRLEEVRTKVLKRFQTFDSRKWKVI